MLDDGSADGIFVALREESQGLEVEGSPRGGISPKVNSAFTEQKTPRMTRPLLLVASY